MSRRQATSRWLLVWCAIATVGVIAWTGRGVGAYFTDTTTATVSVQAGSIAAPSISTASPGPGTVSLSWTTVSVESGTVSYYVNRDGGAATGCGTRSDPLSDTSCVDRDVGAGRHSYTVTAVWRAWTATSLPKDVTLGGTPMPHLVFSAQPAAAVAGSPLGIQPVVTALDQDGNTIVHYDSTVTLSIAPGSSAREAALTGCSGTLHDGVTTFSSCEIDGSAGVYRLRASDGTLTADSAPVSVSAGAPTMLVFLSAPVDGTVSSTASLGPLVVQERDRFGNPATAGETITLSSTGCKGIFSFTEGGPPVTSVSIPAGSSSVTFYYGDPQPGVPTITVSASGLSSASQRETITPAVATPFRLVFTSAPLHGPPSATANLGPVTVQEQDRSGRPTTTAQTITLSSSSRKGVFSRFRNGPRITKVVIPAGSSRATFYYGDARGGTPTIAAAANGLASAIQRETIRPAVIAHPRWGRCAAWKTARNSCSRASGAHRGARASEPQHRLRRRKPARRQTGPDSKYDRPQRARPVQVSDLAHPTD